MRLHELPLGPAAPTEVNCVIEIPKGSSNKYEYDIQTGTMRLDRVLCSPLHYPCDYGFIPSTRYQDGDPTDMLVLATHATFPGCDDAAWPVGVLMMEDDKGPDEKVLAVASGDGRFAATRSLSEVQGHLMKELIHFFEVYKALEWKAVEVLGWKDIDVVLQLIQTYRLDLDEQGG